ncbi:MAG: hypothetical protein HUU41_00140 [Bryobacteraceae bacterium]|nr:alpha/beta hydrolase domain-containing protein [Bryobacterales bacterium]NUM99493.1 hypothetical protein [Bryobacteraceae bacterium]
MNRYLGIPVLALSVCVPLLNGAVARVELVSKTPVLNGKPFGRTGPYQCLSGRIYFTADPGLSANRRITDIDYAPRNKAGLVEYSADFYALVPEDPAKGNGTLLYEVPNRGRKTLLNFFNRGKGSISLHPRKPLHYGDGLLMEQGFSLFWMGWQWDVPAEEDLLRFFVPIARKGGQPITGIVRSDFVPEERVTTIHLADRTHTAYKVLDPSDPSNQLTVRDAAYGPRQVIPRARWQFATEENGRAVPSRTHVYMKDCFEAGRIYEIVYRSQDPPLAGLGLAATRDLISFLKYGGASTDGPLDGFHRHIKRSIGFGSSQSGRFLRKFLYDGFNSDEQDRQVFDGVWAHVAGGGRGSFNHRFAQPSRDARPYFNFLYPTDIFPFSDADQLDRETQITDGILKRARAQNAVPRIFYTNSSYEYYGRSASLIHTSLDGTEDIPPSPLTRIYLIAGAQHGPGAFPPGRAKTSYPHNANDFSWSMRALLIAMNRWISTEEEPPPSRYPTVRAGQLVPLESLRFPAIPGVRPPLRIQIPRRFDYGPDFREKGVVSIEPPKAGKAYGMRLPQVDSDGNETSGIRLPAIEVPLATYTGWNFRSAAIGAPDELFSMIGSTFVFPRTAAERKASGDPRLSIAERYPNRAGFLHKISQSAKKLAAGRLVLEADIPLIAQEAGKQWDYWMTPAHP